MMPWSTEAKNIMLNALRGENPPASISHVALHDDLPGDNGANEIAEADREEITINEPSGGVMLGDAPISITVTISNGPVTVRYASVWSASTGGTYFGYGPIPEFTFTETDTYILDPQEFDLNS